MERIIVRIADYKIASGSNILVTYGLGSCLAVVLYDPAVKTAGMGHVMLPRDDAARAPGNPRKFADLCVSQMFKELQDNGCSPGRMVAKIAGGASMFDIPYSESFCIGERNRESVVAELLKKRIPLIGEDTGGNYGRTVEFNVDNGELVIMSLRNGTKVI